MFLEWGYTVFQEFYRNSFKLTATVAEILFLPCIYPLYPARKKKHTAQEIPFFFFLSFFLISHMSDELEVIQIQHLAVPGALISARDSRCELGKKNPWGEMGENTQEGPTLFHFN